MSDNISPSENRDLTLRLNSPLIYRGSLVSALPLYGHPFAGNLGSEYDDLLYNNGLFNTFDEDACFNLDEQVSKTLLTEGMAFFLRAPTFMNEEAVKDIREVISNLDSFRAIFHVVKQHTAHEPSRLAAEVDIATIEIPYNMLLAELYASLGNNSYASQLLEHFYTTAENFQNDLITGKLNYSLQEKIDPQAFMSRANKLKETLDERVVLGEFSSFTNIIPNPLPHPSSLSVRRDYEASVENYERAAKLRDLINKEQVDLWALGMDNIDIIYFGGKVASHVLSENHKMVLEDNGVDFYDFRTPDSKEKELLVSLQDGGFGQDIVVYDREVLRRVFHWMNTDKYVKMFGRYNALIVNNNGSGSVEIISEPANK